MQVKIAILFIPLGLLSACGGGGSGSSSAPIAVNPSPPVQQVRPSTALVDNPLPVTTQFNQFNEYLAQLPDKSKFFKGSDVYIKLYIADGSALYLGRLQTISTVQIYLPNHIKSVMVDIFSTDPEDQQITEEITL